MRGTLNAPWLLTNRQFRWTGNGHLQLPLAELGKPSPNIDQRHTTVWPWPFTYDLDLQSQASQGQGRPSCQISRSKVKRFKQESAHRQMDGHTHTHTHVRYQTYLSCYAVENYAELMRMKAIMRRRGWVWMCTGEFWRRRRDPGTEEQRLQDHVEQAYSTPPLLDYNTNSTLSLLIIVVAASIETLALIYSYGFIVSFIFTVSLFLWRICVEEYINNRQDCTN